MSNEKNEINEFDEYVNDLNEWQNHQYTPGYYTEKVSPIKKYPSFVLGLVYIFIALAIIVIFISLLIKSEDKTLIFASAIFFIGGFVLFILIGVKCIKVSKNKNIN